MMISDKKELTINKKRDQRPSISESSESASRSSPRTTKKNSCPCGKSSGGRDWNLVCVQCGQKWHSSCSNQKATKHLTQIQVDKMLETWPCPWCFTAPYPRPDSHRSALNESTLLEKTLSCSLLQDITAAVTEVVGKSTPIVLWIPNHWKHV